MVAITQLGYLPEIGDRWQKGPSRQIVPSTMLGCSECGRGLQIVGELSVRWGWHPAGDGKAIFAILAKDDA